MKPLSTELRRQLEAVVIKARDVAEAAARSALQKRGVHEAKPYDHFTDAARKTRNHLRARGNLAGDVRQENNTQPIDRLAGELAYEYWHRMLFARFLAENHLLMMPGGVAVSLEECNELAPEAEPPASNGFALAARYASAMLPRIFRTDDVLLEIEFATEHRLPLEKLLNDLTRQTFEADDSLGWVYQFWQTDEKERVNKLGDKIDGRTLPAVTQLFTEPYMVQFLLHNTVGAWWVGNHRLEAGATQSIPGGTGFQPVFEYLRLNDDGSPAAGGFGGWPKTLAEFTLLDPCCGSGHFLVAAFNLLVPLRMRDEALSARAACDAVLRDNLHGLELDPRCTQIAAFALALAAWKYPDAGGFRELPPLNIACSGQGVAGKKEDWLKLANGDGTLRNGMERLYELFEKAPHLGSLIDPRREDGDLFHSRYAELDGLLKKALQKYGDDTDLRSVGVAAQGIAAAADLLTRKYTLVVTNVPYLGRGKQNETMMSYLKDNYDEGKECLSATFVLRGSKLCRIGGCLAIVTPQSWLYQGKYTELRERFLKTHTWNLLARLGTRAFETITGEVVNVALIAITITKPNRSSILVGIDASSAPSPALKAAILLDPGVALQRAPQADMLLNPNCVVSFSPVDDMRLLSDFADTAEGLSTGDMDRFVFVFWEIDLHAPDWEPLHTGPGDSADDLGLHQVVRWEQGEGELSVSPAARIQGQLGWGKGGILVSEMKNLRACRHQGYKHDKTAGVVVPKTNSDLAAITAFCLSIEYSAAVRAIDMSLKVAPRSLLRVPFDIAYWQAVAAEQYPNGLPEPHSDDPTQWLFKGDIASSTDPLQVAVARLCGYRWPEQDNNRLEAGSTQSRRSPLGGTGFQPVSSETLSRRNLPHIQKPGHAYHVIFRTQGLILPSDARRDVLQACRFWDGKKLELHAACVMSDHVHLLLTPNTEHRLEAGATPTQVESVSLSEILHSIKSFSAKSVNKVMGRQGSVWQDESYDRYIRSEEDFEEKYNYIAANPVKDGLAESPEVYPYLYLQYSEHRLEAGATQTLPGGTGFQPVVDPVEQFVDDDGIVCLPGVRHEAPAAERLADLLRAVGSKTEVDLAVWLRDSFFAEHCKRFHQRPFLWHVWDGRKDGFAALVNYHKLTHKTLENLTYSYLGDWITAQSKSDKPGADLRLAAAQALQTKLKLILAGEPPYDIFVRWKPLHEQAIGWQPDLNDGVRMNIRPFVEADILRKTPNVKWAKDRGKEPARDAADYPWFNAAGERVNDIHLTPAQKQAARDKMQAKGGRP